MLRIVQRDALPVADLEAGGIPAVRIDTAGLGAELAFKGAIRQIRPAMMRILGWIDAKVADRDPGVRAGATPGETDHAIGTTLVASAAMLDARHAVDADLLPLISATDGAAAGGAWFTDLDLD